MEITEYYEDGSIWRQYTINFHDEIEGVYRSWWKNGQLQEECTYVEGAIEGPCYEYHENGQLSEMYNCVNNYIHGQYQRWHENGKLAEKGNYFYDYRSGIFLNWDENGVLESIKFYKSDYVLNNAVFVVNNTIYTAEEYILAYSTKNEEFKNATIVPYKDRESAMQALKDRSGF